MICLPTGARKSLTLIRFFRMVGSGFAHPLCRRRRCAEPIDPRSNVSELKFDGNLVHHVETECFEPVEFLGAIGENL